MSYIQSNYIKVFPTTQRDTTNYPESKLMNEDNIIGLSNRLTGNQSYIISGLNYNGTTLSPGECVINGYYFKINNDISITPTNNEEYLYLKIKLDNNNHLNGTDENNEYDGLAVELLNNIVGDSCYLLLSKKEDGVWNNNMPSRLITNGVFYIDDGQI